MSLISYNNQKECAPYIYRELGLAKLLSTNTGKGIVDIINYLNEHFEKPESNDIIIALYRCYLLEQPLSEIYNPKDNLMYIKQNGIIISTRYQAIKSFDNGKTWYDTSRETWFGKLFDIRINRLRYKRIKKFPYDPVLGY